MPIDLALPQVPAREARLGAITGYAGSLQDLVRQAGDGTLKNRCRSFTQTSACNSGCAQTLLAGIADAAVVNHAPVGCAGDTPYHNLANHYGQAHRGWARGNVRILNSNMDHNDTVFGGGEKLRGAIRAAHQRHSPRVIFVTTSCASGIIGDDVAAIAEECEAEIGTPVVPVSCEGFRTRVWATGFDAAFHAILARVVKRPERRRPELVNVINFRGSARAQLTEMFERLGLVPRLLVPFASTEELAGCSEAAATLTICGTLGSYFGTGLEERFGVPYVKSRPPHGAAGIEAWLRGLGETLGKERQVETLIEEERAAVANELDELRRLLAGTRAVLGMGPSFSHSYVAVLEELGIQVIHLASWHYDQRYDHGDPPEVTRTLAQQRHDIPLTVGDQQNFEIANLLHRLKPDLYVSRHPGSAVWAAKLGIPTVTVVDEYTAFGHRGLVSFGWRVLDALRNRRLVTLLAKRVRLPYTQWWFEQDPLALLEGGER